MLLDILSNGNRPQIVMKNVNAMFQGVKEMPFAADGITLEAFVSNEGEKVPIKMTSKLALKGKVENYLNELIEKMRHELRAQFGRVGARGDRAKIALVIVKELPSDGVAADTTTAEF